MANAHARQLQVSGFIAVLRADEHARHPAPDGLIPLTCNEIQACIGASGGNWCYGYNLTSDGKYCYSNYYHATKMHHSTVKIAGGLE